MLRDICTFRLCLQELPLSVECCPSLPLRFCLMESNGAFNGNVTAWQHELCTMRCFARSMPLCWQPLQTAGCLRVRQQCCLPVPIPTDTATPEMSFGKKRNVMYYSSDSSIMEYTLCSSLSSYCREPLYFNVILIPHIEKQSSIPVDALPSSRLAYRYLVLPAPPFPNRRLPPPSPPLPSLRPLYIASRKNL